MMISTQILSFKHLSNENMSCKRSNIWNTYNKVNWWYAYNGLEGNKKYVKKYTIIVKKILGAGKTVQIKKNCPYSTSNFMQHDSTEA